MKQFLTIIALFIFTSSYSQSDTSSSTLQEAVKEAIAEDKTMTEENLLNMYGADTNQLYQKMQAEMDKIEQQEEEAEASRKLKREIALFFSLLIAFFPAISVFRLVRKKRLEVDKKGILPAVLILLLGGAVLFAFNYFMIWMSLTHGTKFYAVGAVVLMIILAGWAIWVYFRKPQNPQQKQ
ncbi:MAG: hypothetical protein IJK74_05435 [Bacteroidales bacterium]|nr:hypothetical protein [Bacteroidales bacterium]